MPNRLDEMRPFTRIKHFKGKIYQVLGIANPSAVSWNYTNPLCEAKDADTGKYIPIRRSSLIGYDYQVQDWSGSHPTYMLYQAINSFDIFMRPLDDFLSEVDHDKYPRVAQKYKFEVIKN